MRAPISLAAVLAVVALLPGSAAAAPGDLDPTFGGGDGVVEAPSGSGTGLGEIALWNDTIVAAGIVQHGSCLATLLGRWLADGSPDGTFGEGGLASTNSCDGPGSNWTHALSVADDGRIFTAGGAMSSTASPALLTAHTREGAFDAFFSGDGYLQDDLDGAGARDLVRLADGRLVAGGSGDEWAVNRYHDGGAPDDSFDDDGRATYPVVAGGPSDRLLAMVADGDDGAIVATGAAQTPSSDPAFQPGRSGIVIGRIRADGSLDPGFGTGGRTRVEPDGNEAEAFDLVRTADGGFVVAGVADPRVAGHPWILFKFDAAGQPDASFGDGGLVVGGDGEARAIAVDAQGRLVVAVTTPSRDVTVARYLPDGAPDTGFGNGGNVHHPLAGSPEPVDVAVEPDGDIVVGASGWVEASSQYAIVLVRLLGQDRPLPPPPGGPGDEMGPGPQVVPPPPPPVVRRGRATIKILSSRVTRRGVLVRVTWPRGSTGPIRARLWTRKKGVLLGRRTVRVLPGTTSRRFRIALNRRAKRLLRRSGGRLRVRATVRVGGIPARR
jgi:uncharacterized delta-60 repeat protein